MAVKNWFQNWEVSHLASKGIGVLSSVIASHVTVLDGHAPVRELLGWVFLDGSPDHRQDRFPDKADSDPCRGVACDRPLLLEVLGEPCGHGKPNNPGGTVCASGFSTESTD